MKKPNNMTRSDQPGHPSAQSDQSLLCLYEETLGPKLSIGCTVKTDWTVQIARRI